MQAGLAGSQCDSEGVSASAEREKTQNGKLGVVYVHVLIIEQDVQVKQSEALQI